MTPICDISKDIEDRRSVSVRKYIRGDDIFGLEMQLPLKPFKKDKNNHKEKMDIAKELGIPLFDPGHESAWIYLDFGQTTQLAAKYLERIFFDVFDLNRDKELIQLENWFSYMGLNINGEEIVSVSQHPQDYPNFTLYTRPRKKKRNPNSK